MIKIEIYDVEATNATPEQIAQAIEDAIDGAIRAHKHFNSLLGEQ